LDPITDLFSTMHVASVVQARLEATAPWGLIREAEEEAGLIRLPRRIRQPSSRTSVWFRVGIAG
jgi:hypothetical protein